MSNISEKQIIENANRIINEGYDSEDDLEGIILNLLYLYIKLKKDLKDERVANKIYLNGLQENTEEIKRLQIENLELKLGQFPDTTDTYKKIKKELEALKNENR